VKLGQHSCTFKYSTGVAAQQVEPAQPADGAVDFAEVLRKHRGACTQLNDGYWTYEVCLSGTARQFHVSDVYTLGTTGVVQNARNELWIEQGQTCNGMSDNRPRRTIVQFGCRESAMVPELVRVKETSMCVYEAIIAIADFCRDKSFPVLSEAITAHRGSDSPVNDGSEDWLLEVSQLESGGVMCQAFTTEHHGPSPQLRFAEFALELRPSPSTAARPVQVVARRPGRVPLGSSELAVSSDGTSATHGPRFAGALAFVSLER